MDIRKATSRGLVFALVSIGLGAEAMAQEKPAPETVEAVKQKRRDDLRKLEASTQELRTWVIGELADVQADQDRETDRVQKEFMTAEVAREVAEYALKEYEQGSFRQDLATAKGEIALAKADLERAEDQWTVLRQAKQKGSKISRFDEEAADLTLEKARFEVEQAKTSLQVLELYTRPNEVKRLQGLIDSARALELAKKALLEAERTKGEKLREQLKKFRVRSPEDFVIALINDAAGAEAKVVELTMEARTIETKIRANPADAAPLVETLRAKQKEASTLMDQAKAQLTEATALAEHTRARRVELAEAEARLKRERAIVDAMDRPADLRK